MSSFFFAKLFFTGFFVFGLLSMLVAMIGDRYPKGHTIREVAFATFVILFTLCSVSIPLSIICAIWGW